MAVRFSNIFKQNINRKKNKTKYVKRYTFVFMLTLLDKRAHNYANNDS